jgi:hypothetical protein
MAWTTQDGKPSRALFCGSAAGFLPYADHRS